MQDAEMILDWVSSVFEDWRGLGNGCTACLSQGGISVDSLQVTGLSYNALQSSATLRFSQTSSPDRRAALDRVLEMGKVKVWTRYNGMVLSVVNSHSLTVLAVRQSGPMMHSDLLLGDADILCQELAQEAARLRTGERSQVLFQRGMTAHQRLDLQDRVPHAPCLNTVFSGMSDMFLHRVGNIAVLSGIFSCWLTMTVPLLDA